LTNIYFQLQQDPVHTHTHRERERERERERGERRKEEKERKELFFCVFSCRVILAV